MLQITKRTDARLLERMSIHYSEPDGFVGRNICYAINHSGIYYGHIVAGSSIMNLFGRNEFFGITNTQLNNIVNNTFFNVSKVNEKYPVRNFTTWILKQFRKEVVVDWKEKYHDKVIGFETLIELPRKGECYRRDKWEPISITDGYTCKRLGGQGTDSWSGKRVWNTTHLRPKLVYCRRI